MNQYCYRTRGSWIIASRRVWGFISLLPRPDWFWKPTSLISNDYGDSSGGTVVWACSKLQKTKFRRKIRIYLYSFVRISGVVLTQAWATLDIALQRRRLFAKTTKIVGWVWPKANILRLSPDICKAGTSCRTLFIYQLTYTTLRNVELLKHSKIHKNAPTCFGLHGDHLQGAKVSTWLKVTR